MNKLIAVLVLFVLVSCDEPRKEVKTDPFAGMSKRERKSALEGALTRASRKEQIQIEGYLKRHQIPAVKTATGVHYYIYEEGEGKEIEDGQNVLVDYVVTKITGDTLYTTSKELDEFVVANSEKESGLHEAMKLLKPGSKAIIILPSHRAHGVSGDSEKIPPLTTVVYNLTVKASF